MMENAVQAWAVAARGERGRFASGQEEEGEVLRTVARGERCVGWRLRM